MTMHNRPIPLIIADTIARAVEVAEDLGIEAHVRASSTAGRGCVATAVFIDDSAWPLTDDAIADLLPVVAHHGGPVYRVQKVFL